MRYALLRVLTFMLFAMILGFIAEAELKIPEGQVFLVGKCSVVFDGLTPDLIESPNAFSQKKQNTIGIAQAELKSYQNGKPVFKIRKIFSVKTDSKGYFMVKNVPANYTYLVVGTQFAKNIPVSINAVTVASPNESAGKVINLGHHKFRFVAANGKSFSDYSVDKSERVDQVMDHFIQKDWLQKISRKIKDYSKKWGQGVDLTIVKSSQLNMVEFEKASWHEINS